MQLRNLNSDLGDRCLAKLKKFTAEVFLQCFRQMRQLEKMISTRLEES